MIPLYFRPGRPGSSPLIQGEVHLWRIRLRDLDKEQVARWSEWLAESELERIAEVRDATRKARIGISRMLLRRLLGAYLGIQPGSVSLITGDSGRPDLDPKHHPDGPGFNLSHSGDLLMIALAPAARIGLDVEFIRERKSIEQLGQRCFTDRERQAIKASSHPLEAFYRGWTRKEALHKALGSGVFQGLRDTEVSLGDVVTPAIYSIRGSKDQAREWQLLDIRAEEDAVAAIALPRGQWRVRTLSLDDPSADGNRPSG